MKILFKLSTNPNKEIEGVLLGNDPERRPYFYLVKDTKNNKQYTVHRNQIKVCKEQRS